MANADRIHRRRCGFTLVELLLIIVALGIAAAIAAPRLAGASDAATDPTRIHLRALETTLGEFFTQNGRYPTEAELRRAPADRHRGASFGVLIDEGYLSTAPMNPATQGATVGIDWIYDPATGRIWPADP